MEKSLGIILIVLALFLGFAGFNKLNDTGSTVKFLGITISAEDEEKEQTAYILLGAGVLCLIAGISVMQGKKITA